MTEPESAKEKSIEPESTERQSHRQRARALALFLAIALGCAALLAVTVQFTRERIDRNHAAREADTILRLTRLESPPASGIWQGDVWASCDGTLLMRGAAQGYAGPIRWMLSARLTADGPRIGRVMVTNHQETPGIADFLNDPEHPWLLAFAGRGADAAELDTLTGATITTRALAQDIGARLALPLDPPAECPP
jgi:Na+-translocating ferredoxin:NAD+ oxidoreductase RnfG subunit